MTRSPVIHRTHLLAAAMLLVASTAAAQPAEPAPAPPGGGGVCVVIDPSRDTLTEQERVAVRSLVLQAFEANQMPTDGSGVACSETYTVSNVKLGNTINVAISGPRGTRTGRASTLDDVPNVYSQLVKSLITGAPVETGGGAVDRTNVTRDQAAPRRVAADSLKYVQLGYGTVVAPSRSYGPAFGFGYRKELDRIGLDVSFSMLVGNDRDETDGFTMSLIKLLGLWYQDPIADGTVYYGAGLSYGFTAVFSSGTDYGGSGMQGHLIAGYEAFRSSTIRGFAQFEATLPFYKSHASGSDSNTRYSPSVMATFGIGWGRSNVVRVVND